MSEIIGEIAALPPAKQRQVIRFTRKLEATGPLSPPELGALAKRLAACEDEREAGTIKKRIMKGFYGGKVCA